MQLDILGSAFAIGSVICYFLALEWGGVREAWNRSSVIGILIGWILLSIAFGVVQWFQKERASIIPRILMQRHVSGGSAFMFLCVASANPTLLLNPSVDCHSLDSVAPIF